ncbi:hypothetical protein QTO31_04345 [Chloroflexus sp. MS-CIW-1]|jgi:hypothetical protein|uniref:hypothetical protein n=1 Tax=unclassified Chloroflexus TaxID=2633855 RepID=UPI000A6EAA73|nr:MULTISPECIES: hypothetical protein [unclassified Chloroflexus]MDN5271194.1 hypothetical protein [Chloroflexus sp. MS-CIW-1]
MSIDDTAVYTAKHQLPADVEGTIVIILERDGSLSYHPPKLERKYRIQPAITAATPEGLRSSSFIDRIIRIAFGVLTVYVLAGAEDR